MPNVLNAYVVPHTHSASASKRLAGGGAARGGGQRGRARGDSVPAVVSGSRREATRRFSSPFF
ncbi:hypothetical protein [Oryza sativa Japonica Group]|uniref:Uncharacterized protein n=1 Tax=Oryza sativa subsp. japonica TaxID=39947 RepID=Q8S093_ORYSJ|nr:hypothetical protein [Oryza sativa Japonica Group]